MPTFLGKLLVFHHLQKAVIRSLRIHYLEHSASEEIRHRLSVTANGLLCPLQFNLPHSSTLDPLKYDVSALKTF
ncbi:hypothetical protein [Leptolyngbya sp. FACHB-16]|uniref:hypothetical protein n=1 Tax=unclassified Leptolyngbya TaxID=2650499 RepID=UPI001685571E|nr:hypothetical protein [Leptolyngbya sp. FACHB-16]MBD1909647.1 hypothetical protein [Leptolyngbya sp. FACHB-8]MBD2157576.1 hypothetical protein [Leptolyngbya sp. FACHB-16]